MQTKSVALGHCSQGSEKQREALRNTKSVAKRNAFRSGTLCETATETKKRSATQSETATQIRKRSATSSETETLFRNSFRNAKILLRNEILFSLAFYCFSHLNILRNAISFRWQLIESSPSRLKECRQHGTFAEPILIVLTRQRTVRDRFFS